MPVVHDYESLFQEAAPRMYRALLAYTGGRVDIANDAVAEAFARALQYDRSVRDPLPWLYRTTFRLAAQEMARERRELIVPTELNSGHPVLGSPVWDALRRLPPNQRAALFLRYVANFSVREVAELMGISSPTVRVHLHRARLRMRSILGTEQGED